MWIQHVFQCSSYGCILGHITLAELTSAPCLLAIGHACKQDSFSLQSFLSCQPSLPFYRLEENSRQSVAKTLLH
jgi:hypothetical protein